MQPNSYKLSYLYLTIFGSQTMPLPTNTPPDSCIVTIEPDMDLPLDLLTYILTWTDMQTICSATLVSKHWNNAAVSDILWVPLVVKLRDSLVRENLANEKISVMTKPGESSYYRYTTMYKRYRFRQKTDKVKQNIRFGVLLVLSVIGIIVLVIIAIPIVLLVLLLFA
jgi:hypothetical protein